MVRTGFVFALDLRGHGHDSFFKINPQDPAKMIKWLKSGLQAQASSHFNGDCTEVAQWQTNSMVLRVNPNLTSVGQFVAAV